MRERLATGARRGRIPVVNAGERLVTVLVTVAVLEAADPEDAAALVADTAVSSALDVVHAVGVEGHLPVAGSTVMSTGTGRPAVVLMVGADTTLLRHLDGEVQQTPLPALAPDPPVGVEVVDHVADPVRAGAGHLGDAAPACPGRTAATISPTTSSTS